MRKAFEETTRVYDYKDWKEAVAHCKQMITKGWFVMHMDGRYMYDTTRAYGVYDIDKFAQDLLGDFLDNVGNLTGDREYPISIYYCNRMK